MIEGSCHCGAVRYRINGELQGFVHCHCTTCRKINGTVYGSSAMAAGGALEVTKGEDDLERYESNPGKRRCFCRRCGSHVFAYWEKTPETAIVRVGTLDSDPGVLPQAHIWVSHRADWAASQDDLPRFPEAPKSRG